MPRTPSHIAQPADPGLAWFELVTCVLLRVFWRTVIEPIRAYDPCLPKQQRLARLQIMIRALMYAEARLTRALHRAASRIAGVACPSLTLASYMRSKPRNADTLMMRIRELGVALRNPMRRARALARRIKQALAASPRFPRPAAIRPASAVARSGDGAPACARRVARSECARSRSGEAQPRASPESPPAFFIPCAHAARGRARMRALQPFLHTKSAPPERAH